MYGCCMVERPIRFFGDPVLKMRAVNVTQFGDQVRQLVRDLLDTTDLPRRAGVAAPQIGVSLRAFSYNIDGSRGYVINPEVVHVSLRLQEDDYEGCLSVPNIWAITPRAESVVVRGVDSNNDPIVIEGSGILARCLLHEVDHLDGLLYIDRLDKVAKRQAFRDMRKQRWFLEGISSGSSALSD